MHDRPTGEMVRCSKARSMFASRACRKSIMIGKSLTHGQMTKVRLAFFVRPREEITADALCSIVFIAGRPEHGFDRSALGKSQHHCAALQYAR